MREKYLQIYTLHKLRKIFDIGGGTAATVQGVYMGSRGLAPWRRLPEGSILMIQFFMLTDVTSLSFLLSLEGNNIKKLVQDPCSGSI